MTFVILIDGRSGSGKTELAKLLVENLGDAELVRLDDLYAGWDGLDAASAAVPAIIRQGRWQAWDWARDEPGQWRHLSGAGTLIIEGVGALSRASALLADVAIWVELDDSTRKARALARDGETYAPHWDRWAAQERRFIEREKPQRLASVIVES